MSLTSSPSSTQEPIIDMEAIENLRALNPEDTAFLKEIIDIFLDDTPARIAELHQSLATGDTAGFSRAAHSIKGSSSNLGASRLRYAAEKLEQGAKATPIAALAHAVPEIEAEFAAAKAALQKIA